MRKKLRTGFVVFLAFAALAALLYQLPPVKSRLEWRIATWRASVWRALFPPEEVVFIPSGNLTRQAEVDARVTATLRALLPSPTLSPIPNPSIPNTPIPTIQYPHTPTPTPTPTSTPLPLAVALPGTRHEYEQWNNCGPATLGIQLSFWGWKGDQRDTAAFLKPNPRDKNVGPAELVRYVEQFTGLKAVYRAGGTLDLLKALIAAGFPVIVEKTLELPGLDGWVGHYSLVTGYDEGKQRFITQDSYIMADFPVPYEHLAAQWQAFDYTFVVVYPPEREAQVNSVLGAYADSRVSAQLALALARQETASLTGRPLFFAWFNQGTSLVGLGDYAGAALAYDRAFVQYAALDPAERPWRMVWYQHGPYQAYYETKRYQDVIDLADTTLRSMGEQTVEETFYWRGLAKAALGDRAGALADLQRALELNPNFEEARQELAGLEG